MHGGRADGLVVSPWPTRYQTFPNVSTRRAGNHPDLPGCLFGLVKRLLRGEDPIILPGRADPAEAAELPELVVEMSRQLAELTERVQELGAEVMRWHREGARAAPGSAAGSS